MKNVAVAGNFKAGALAASVYGTIDNCHVNGGTITSTTRNNDDANNVGGLVGYLGEGNNVVQNSSAKNVTVIAYRDLGGLVGTAQSGSQVIDNTVEDVAVVANQLVAYNEVKDANAGEVVGRNLNATVENNTANDVTVSVLKVENNVINISSVAGLLAWGASDYATTSSAGITMRLTNDIDLTGVTTDGDSFAPIGSTGEYRPDGRLLTETFEGTFDGGGHTIKGINQSGWDFGYMLGKYGSLGLFAELNNATVKDIVIEGLDAAVEGGDVAFIAGSVTGTCVFENITIKNSSIGTYNNGCGSIVGWSGPGNYTFRNIKLGEDVVLGGLWGSFDSSIGGIVGQAEPGATYNFENVEIKCRIDAYNDCTASYKYGNYRMCGMIIGRCNETAEINGENYPDLSKYNLSFKDVTVTYGDWMNYHYCTLADGSIKRAEAGYAYDGITDHSTCQDEVCRPFDQLIGGDQMGVKGLPAVDGVTVEYPASYQGN